MRDVSGVSNNLNPDNAFWGAADVPFLNVGSSGDLGYGHYLTGNPDNAVFDNPDLMYTTPDYTITGSGGTVNIESVVDYTPRMITQTIMTGGVRLLLDSNKNIVYWNPDTYSTDNAYKALIDDNNIDTSKLVVGAAVVNTYQDVLGTFDAGMYAYGLLMRAYGVEAPGDYHVIDLPGLDGQVPYIQAAVDQVALIESNGIDVSNLSTGEVLLDMTTSPYGLLGELGVPDRQNPDNGEYFLQSQNPGVAPTNGFFAVFGQFFDHGLDFIGKGASGTKITIPLSTDDPLYGVIGQDGRQTTSITISRANVYEVDENGVPLYINHTSPFIDQSQTYGSIDEITNILREWVEDPNDPDSYIPGARLLDGYTSVAWTNGFGVETQATLPTVNELRLHLEATQRAGLIWDDILNLRQRDATGQLLNTDLNTAGVQTQASGHAMLLDLNPHVDRDHLEAALGANGAAAIIATLTAEAAAGGMMFGMTAEGVVYLDVPAMGPSPAMHLEGVSALAPWLNFANFSIAPQFGPSMSDAVYNAVSDVMLASVGDHYLAGDGRVNENVALTSIHHIFHMEHDYQAQNMEIALFQQDALNGTPDNHSILQSWQVMVSGGTLANDNISNVGGHWEATGGILARDMNNDFYVVANANNLATGHSIVLGRDEQPISAAGSFTDAAGYISWDQERIFQGVKLVVEMEYQHTAVDQYARAVSPDIPEFSAYSTDLDATINMAYSQGAFRFGHSTLRETIDTLDPNGDMTGRIMSYALEKAFLNPALFEELGAKSIVMGMTRQVMNDIDEFVTPALQQGLLGLPMDLAAINIARGRDVGLPTFNQTRALLDLTAFTSWNEFGQNLYHQESLVNFIAAYSFDGDVAAAQDVLDGAAAGNVDALRFMNGGDKGYDLVDLWTGGMAEAHISGGLLGETFNVVFVDQIQRLMDGDRFYYLYRLAGTQFGDEIINEQFKDMVERTTGATHLNGNIFGYSDQYYELGDNPVATQRLYDSVDGAGAAADPLVDAGDPVDVYGGPYFDADGVQYLVIPRDLAGNATAPLYADANGDGTNSPLVAIGDVIDADVVYYTASGQVADLRALAAEQHKFGAILADHPGMGIYTNGGASTAGSGTTVTVMGRGFVLDQRPDLNPNALNVDGTPTSGAASNEVIAGTPFDDLIYLGFGDDTGYGDEGNDTIYGGSGGDRIYGGAGNDLLFGEDLPDVIDGGDGDDTIYGGDSGSSVGGFDQLIGGAGNDLIYGGVGIDKIYGNSGDDAIYGGADTDPFIFAGDGNDIVDGGDEQDNIYGNGGDDLLLGGNDKDIMFGQDGDDILRPGIPSGSANAGGGNTGNAIFGPDEVVGGFGNVNETDPGFDLLDVSDNTLAFQVEINLNAQNNPLVMIDQNQVLPTMIEMDGVAGTQADDTILGNLDGNWLIGAGGIDLFEADIAPRLNGAQAEVLADRGGNDVIIGGAIRLDALIGRYGTGTTDSFVGDAYETSYGLIGASHRVAEGASLIGGLLNGTATSGLFALHFTDMLRSLQFKDMILGNADNEIGNIGDGVAISDDADDTVELSGNFEDYSAIAVDINGDQVTDLLGAFDTVVGVRLTDNGNAEREPTDGTDLMIGIENFVFGDGSTHTLREVIGYPPTLALDYDGGDGEYYDNLNSTIADGSNGQTAWLSNWIEQNDGGNSVNNGQIQIDNNFASAPRNAMTIGDGDGASIARTVDLSIADTATLSFSYQEYGLATDESVTVFFSPTGLDADFVTVRTITGDGGGLFDFNTQSGNVSIDLTGPFTASAVIKVEATGIQNTAGGFAPDYVSLDDMRVTFTQAPTNLQTDITRAFVEGDGGITVVPRAFVTDMDGTTLTSAKIVLTNAKDGDNLVWGDGTSGNGFSVASDTSVSGQITVTLTSDQPQSYDAFAARLDNIQYVNTSQNPDETPRVIQATVNDGRLDSAPATTTITVQAVDSPANANNDNVYAGATTFDIPEWALVANDNDPESDPFYITDTYGNNGLSASQPSGGVISVNDTFRGSNRFDYHVTGGDNARVQVRYDTNGTLTASGGDDIVIGSGGSDAIDAGTGDDIIIAGGGNDGIVWFANGNTSGHDFVDGGDGTDTFTINGNNSTENFQILTAAVAITAGFLPTNAAAEIVVIRNNEIIAELENVEELIVNTTNAPNDVPLDAGTTAITNGDTIYIEGNFDTTSLAYNTIHINGSDAHDEVDISGLRSDHRIVFDTKGGDDMVHGTLRSQDEVIRPTAVTSGDQPPAEQGAQEEAPADGDDCSEGDADQMTGADGGDGAIMPPPATGDMTAPIVEGITATGTSEAETLLTDDGDDYVFAAGGADNVLTFGGADMVFGDGGADRIFTGEGDDYINAGAGADLVFGGEGNDTFVAGINDGSDVYHGDGVGGGTGIDMLDMSLMTAAVTVDLGTNGNTRGSVYSAQTGSDTLFDIENVRTGSGDDVITASNTVNVIDGGDGMDIFRFTSAQAADGDTLTSFQAGDTIDLSGIDANTSLAGDQSFMITSGAFTGAGQLMVTEENRDGDIFTVVRGNVNDDDASDFTIEIRGSHALSSGNFDL